MSYKDTYFVKVYDIDAPDVVGIGECNLFEGLSCDDRPDYEATLAKCCREIDHIDLSRLADYPSIVFGIETAMQDLKNGGRRIPFVSDWSKGESQITINGLVWMGNFKEMTSRVATKIEQGFRCIKCKIGGIDFSEELEILSKIRKQFSAADIEIRLDANGAFRPQEALEKLKGLSDFDIHSIEQPIAAGNTECLRRLCRESPIPIALDEELIGINDFEGKKALIEYVIPQYIILKPALCGGFTGASQWIDLAEQNGIGWWVTSALESNIGLNAIAQWSSTLNVAMPQGLGTGQLYTNNIESPLEIIGDKLLYNTQKAWSIPALKWIET